MAGKYKKSNLQVVESPVAGSKDVSRDESAPTFPFNPDETYTWANEAQDSLKRGSDDATVPVDQGNNDYQSFLAWQASGKTASAFVPPPAEKRQWTPYQLYGLFTSAEQQALRMSTDQNIQQFIFQLQLFQVVYPDDAEFQQALGYMVMIGMLTQDRMVTIIGSNPPAT